MGFIAAQGNQIVESQIQSQLARELLGVSERAFVQLIEIRATESADVVVLEVEVERPRLTTHQIHHREIVAVVCPHDSAKMFDVFSLRDDFPLVPHINLRDEEFPRSLCLFEEPLEVLRLRHITGAKLVERIRWWLKLTAVGELHGSDQPLEPMWMPSPHMMVVAPEVLAGLQNTSAQPIGVDVRKDGNDRITCLLHTRVNENSTQAILAVAIGILTPTVQHGVITHVPRSLYDLHSLLAKSGFDLLACIRSVVAEWTQQPRLKAHHLIVLLGLPKARELGAAAESTELCGFFLPKLLEVGIGIGVWGEGGGMDARLIPFDATRNGQDVILDHFEVTPWIDQSLAAQLNGLPQADTRTIVQVGLGALGSQVFENLFKAGFGRFTLIDNDRLLPHNLARHALDGHFVGVDKVLGLQARNQKTLPENPINFVAQNVIALDTAQSKTLFADASVILDCSASVPVARHLSALDVAGRRISLFLNPNGSDSVMLAEDQARQMTLVQLEAQYYQWIIDESQLSEHLSKVDQRVRYGASCRSVSARVPQDAVALHAAVGSQALKTALKDSAARAVVWHSTPDGEIHRVSLPVQVMREFTLGSWTVHLSPKVEEQARSLRQQRLPVETGGTLIGMIDLERHTLYVTGLLPSPQDSQEYPTMYIRGANGLTQQYEKIHHETLGMLEYIGEWHSHPQGHSAKPSDDDMKVMQWIQEHLGADGLPGLMLIVAEDELGVLLTNSHAQEIYELRV